MHYLTINNLKYLINKSVSLANNLICYIHLYVIRYEQSRNSALFYKIPVHCIEWQCIGGQCIKYHLWSNIVYNGQDLTDNVRYEVIPIECYLKTILNTKEENDL